MRDGGEEGVRGMGREGGSSIVDEVLTSSVLHWPYVITKPAAESKTYK